MKCATLDITRSSVGLNKFYFGLSRLCGVSGAVTHDCLDFSLELF